MENMLRQMAKKNIVKAQAEIDATLSGITSLSSFKKHDSSHPINDLISELRDAQKRLNGAIISIQKWGLEDEVNT
jgi:hypothetical protein